MLRNQFTPIETRLIKENNQLTDKVSRRNLQIKNLKKKISILTEVITKAITLLQRYNTNDPNVKLSDIWDTLRPYDRVSGKEN